MHDARGGKREGRAGKATKQNQQNQKLSGPYTTLRTAPLLRLIMLQFIVTARARLDRKAGWMDGHDCPVERSQEFFISAHETGGATRKAANGRESREGWVDRSGTEQKTRLPPDRSQPAA
ncbi:hypothetical protein Dda_5479 [Drechslerella dactyloides]|uniref:Uncharacterized protein n=1 Tax=Drechslerella dactyloides TaxID=74499 RepID=A0AAD6NIW6_DREDA|nr:hypothetical protein Dda_5479 [Drechslerella dactyloides]